MRLRWYLVLRLAEIRIQEQLQKKIQIKQKNPKTVTIKSFNANNEETDLEVPYDAQRIAVMDMAALDILDSLGLGDRVVGSSSTSLDYLQEYVTNDEIADLGTIKEADMEAVMSCEPDVIFIGGRLAQSYDALSEIAPVVYLSTDTEIGLVKRCGEKCKDDCIYVWCGR